MSWGNKDYANNIPTYLAANYPGNTNVYLVNSSRMANSGAIGESVSHQGWVKVYPGKGSIKSATVVNPDKTKNYATANLIFTGANTSPASGNVVVSGTGISQTFAVNIINSGKNYTTPLVITANSAVESNNALLNFSYVGSGRLGRNLTETLVAISDITTISANSANTFFTD